MKYVLLIVVLLILPSTLAHGTIEEHALENEELETNLGPLGGGPNDIAKVLPWNYFLAGKWIEGIFVTLLWIVTLVGIGKLVFLLLGKHL